MNYKFLYVLFLLLISTNINAQSYLRDSLDSYLIHNGFSGRTKHAVSFLKAGVKAEDPERIYHYAVMLTGLCYKKHVDGLCKYNIHDDRKSAKYFKIAADLNNSEAQLQYAKCLAFGIGTKQNKVLAKQYFSRAASHGNFRALVYEAECYLIGFGCAVDSSQAYECYKTIYLGKNKGEKCIEERIREESCFKEAEASLKRSDFDKAIKSIKSIAFPIEYYICGNYGDTLLRYAP